MQDIYTYVTTYITGHIHKKLVDMLQGREVDESTSKDLLGAYGRLLSATNMVGHQCPITISVSNPVECTS